MEFVKAAIDGENIGRNGTTDLLCLSFSTNDLIGHSFGPDSHEVLDITLRSDKLMADVLAYLDQRIGRDRYSLVMAADHGICPLPEVAVRAHPEARRINVSDFLGGLDDHLDKVFGKKNDVPGQWVERDAPGPRLPPVDLPEPPHHRIALGQDLLTSRRKRPPRGCANGRRRLTVFTRTQLHRTVRFQRPKRTSA